MATSMVTPRGANAMRQEARAMVAASNNHNVNNSPRQPPPRQLPPPEVVRELEKGWNPSILWGQTYFSRPPRLERGIYQDPELPTQPWKQIHEEHVQEEEREKKHKKRSKKKRSSSQSKHASANRAGDSNGGGALPPIKNSPRKAAPPPKPSMAPAPPKTQKSSQQASSPRQQNHNAKGDEKKKSKKDDAASSPPQTATVNLFPIENDEFYHDLFDRSDPNGNELLSLAELDKTIVECYPEFNNKPAIMRAYKAADKDGTGFVSRDEFPFFMRYLVYFNNLYHLFDVIDSSDDRRVSREEFADVADVLGVSESDFDDMDANGGGIVLFDEFCLWFAKRGEVDSDALVDRISAFLSKGKRKKKKNSKSAAAAPPPALPQVAPPSDAVVANVKGLPSEAELMKLFDSVDANGNQLLSLAELDLCILRVFPKFNNKPAIMRAYKAADRDGTGFVSREEFPFFMRFIVYYHGLFELFDAIDDSDDRRVSREEFATVAPVLGVDADATFDAIDGDGHGMILFDEFCTWFARNRPECDFEELREKVQKHLKAAAKSPKKKKEPTVAPELPQVEVPTEEVLAEEHIAIPSEAELHDLFDRCDPNGNQLLSLAELDKAIVEAYPTLNNKPAIMRAYKAADKDGTGFVSREEFPFFMRFIVYYDRLWKQFDAIDTSDDRRVTREEFVAAAPKLGLDGDANAVFDEIDANGGGVVLFDEFCTWRARHH